MNNDTRDTTTRLEQLMKDVKQARDYVGDNLPAAQGLVVIGMLENALEKARSPRRAS